MLWMSPVDCGLVCGLAVFIAARTAAAAAAAAAFWLPAGEDTPRNDWIDDLQMHIKQNIVLLHIALASSWNKIISENIT